jgi:ParB family transcriptional regulator, chromosome partitioning protein
MADRKLGRGLEGLLQTMPTQPAPDLPSAQPPTLTLPLAMLDPNPDQPRQGMEVGGLEHLRESIREHGLLQPVVVRRHGDRYQIIAGERRFRAAESLGLAEISVVVRDVPDDQMLELALVENLQREDLDPIEKAESFKSYLSSSGRTQDAAAVRLGLDRSTIANMIRLLDLPAEVQSLVRGGVLAMGHARAILSVEERSKQIELAQQVAREGLSVREVERLAAQGAPPRRRRRASARGGEVHDLEARLRQVFGTKVKVMPGTKPGSGKIVVEFYTQDDLDRILSLAD